MLGQQFPFRCFDLCYARPPLRDAPFVRLHILLFTLGHPIPYLTRSLYCDAGVHVL